MAQSIFFVLANDSVKLVLALRGFLKAADEVLFVTFYLITLGYSLIIFCKILNGVMVNFHSISSNWKNSNLFNCTMAS